MKCNTCDYPYAYECEDYIESQGFFTLKRIYQKILYCPNCKTRIPMGEEYTK